MLLNDFFYIQQLVVEAETIHADLSIQTDHPIFSGHFPGQPVVPGVCQLQMIKEVLERALDIKTDIKSSQDIKFLAVIDPNQHPTLSATIKYTNTDNGAIQVVASLLEADLIFFKCKSVLQIKETK